MGTGRVCEGRGGAGRPGADCVAICCLLSAEACTWQEFRCGDEGVCVRGGAGRGRAARG